MLNSILVLRIHLLEIEKVNELCTDFSDRYIETLRLKLNNDNIFKCDDETLNEDTDDIFSTEPVDSDKNKKCHKSNVAKATNKKLKKCKEATSTPIKRENLVSPSTEISGDTSLSKIKFNMLNLSTNQSTASNESDLDDESQQTYDLNDDPDEENTYDNFEDLNDESDANNEQDDMYDDNNSLTRSPRSTLKSSSSSCSFVNKAGSFGSNADDSFLKKSNKSKRGILPKNATIVMKKWLFQHIVVSYKLNIKYRVRVY